MDTTIDNEIYNCDIRQAFFHGKSPKKVKPITVSDNVSDKCRLLKTLIHCKICFG